MIRSMLRRTGAGGFEPEYQAVLDYAVANSISTPDATQNEINNAIIKNCKKEGIWNWDVFYFFKQPSGLADFSLINWANPGNHNASVVNAPDFIANSGWKNTSGTSYLRTNFIPNSDATFTSLQSSMFAEPFDIDTTFGGLTILLGGREANNTNQVFWLNNVNGTMNTRTFASGGALCVVGQSNINNLYISVSDFVNSLGSAYVPALSSSYPSSAIGGLSQRELYLLAYNNNGTATFGRNPGIKYFGVGVNITGKTNELYNILNNTY